MNITILNKHHKPQIDNNTFYIGRGSPLGNPFEINKHGTREEVIELYKKYLELQIQQNNIKICNELNKIANVYLTGNEVKLLCFCSPNKCHGEIIANTIINHIKGK